MRSRGATENTGSAALRRSTASNSSGWPPQSLLVRKHSVRQRSWERLGSRRYASHRCGRDAADPCAASLGSTRCQPSARTTLNTHLPPPRLRCTARTLHALGQSSNRVPHTVLYESVSNRTRAHIEAEERCAPTNYCRHREHWIRPSRAPYRGRSTRVAHRSKPAGDS